MARNQKNFSYFMYVDDQAISWNVRGESGGPAGAIDGNTTNYTYPPFGPQSATRHVRYCVWQDALFRTKRTIIYTPTAFAAITAGDTLDFPVEGTATAVTYTLKAKVAEKQPFPAASRHLADT
jgi:hypothetical protein